jgi:heme exporter protein A
VDQAELQLQAIELECVRGQRRLFQRLSFTVGPGEMLWVQGANGSGKTSLLRLLCGLMRPDAGSVFWRGHEVRGSREQFNGDLLYAGHAPAVKDDLTALENLRFGLAQAGIEAAAECARTALAEFGLQDRVDAMTRALSQGQRRRVGLARLALAAAKPLWILDEPFTALDREATQLVQTHLEAHLRRGASVVFTSHQEVDFGAAQVRRLRLDA